MIKLGMIGFSEGNGHPYSWGAIINGYEKSKMDDCGFPVISEYLSKRNLPEEAIQGASVTHIWTQDRKLSEHIAASAKIDNICSTYLELAAEVDAILLARDDWQSHLDIGLELLKTGKPVYIDKPIAIDLKNLDILLEAQKFEGQIFSCSALRFGQQLRLSSFEKKELGNIRYINCTVPKSWEKYAVHIIDPVVGLFANEDSIKSIQYRADKGINEAQVMWESGLVTNFTSFGDLPAQLKFDFIGESGNKSIVWDDAFSTFKAALEVFVHRVGSKNFVCEKEHHTNVVRIIEKGMI